MRSKHTIYGYLLSAFLLATGCTGEEVPAGNGNGTRTGPDVNVGITVRSIIAQTIDGVNVSTIRIVAVDPATGWVVANKTTASGNFPDTGVAGGTGKFTLSLHSGTYHFYTIANETPAMTAVLNGLVNGRLLESLPVQTPSAESALVLFHHALVEVRPSGGSPTTTATVGEVRESGQTAWSPALSVHLERLAAKITFALKRKTNNSDKFTVKRVAIVQLPLYSYAVPRAYDGAAFSSIVLYDNSTGISFNQDSDPTVSFGSAIVPEYLLQAQSADYASSIKILTTYNGIDNVVYTIPLPGNVANQWNLLRNYRYDLTATIQQAGRVDYTPYVEYGVSPWTDATGEDLSIGGSITFTGAWSPSTPVVNSNTVAVYNNSYAEYSFTLAYPAGATWRASLTNGLDFAFDYSDNAVSSGVAAPGQPYTIRVKPLRPVTVGGVKTQLYITVNNVAVQTEIDLVPSQSGTRYTITQIPQ